MSGETRMVLIQAPPNDDLIKCGHCGEIGKFAAHYPDGIRKVCSNCISNKELISPLDWRIYQTMEFYKSQRNYAVLTAQRLGIPRKKVKAIASRLSRKGLKITRTPKPKKVVGKHRLSNKQHLILTTVMRDEYLINANYIYKASKELNIQCKTISYNINKLKEKGFTIPSAQERAINLENYVLEQLKVSTKTRVDFIVSLAKDSGFSQNTIQGIVRKHEKEKCICLKKGYLIEQVEEVIINQRKIELKELYKKFSYYAKRSILAAIRKLESQNILIIDKVHQKKIIITWNPKEAIA